MSLQTLNLLSDHSVGSAWSKNYGGTFASGLNDGSDATYASINSSASTGTHLQETLLGIPSNVASISAPALVLRCLAGATKGLPELTGQVWNSAGTTALTSQGAFLPSSSLSTISTSVTLLDSTIADWTNCYFDIANTPDGNNVTLSVAEAYVTLTVVLFVSRTLSDKLGGRDGGTLENVLWRRMASDKLGEHDSQALRVIYARLALSVLGMPDTYIDQEFYGRRVTDKLAMPTVATKVPERPVFRLAPPGVVYSGPAKLWTLKPR